MTPCRCPVERYTRGIDRGNVLLFVALFGVVAFAALLEFVGESVETLLAPHLTRY